MSPVAVLILSFALAAPVPTEDAAMPNLTLRSPSFDPNQPIPARHSCEGADVSPALSWQGLPAGTKSLALVVDDPDAPRGVWVHWVLYDLPPTLEGLSEDVRLGELHTDTREGRNGWRTVGWRGPCPPSGRHRYFFKLYALDVALGARGELTAAELEAAMSGHVLARAELVGTYERRSGR